MKKILIVVLTVLSAGFMNAQKLNDNGLYVNDSKLSPNLPAGELYTGTVTETKNGMNIELSVKDGVIEGPASYYYASGKLMENGSFTKGQKDQKWIRYNENGSISAIAFYTLGKKSGTWLVYDDNGKKRFEMNYADGQKTGVWTSWDESGVATTKDYSHAN